MRSLFKALGAAAGISILAACTSGQSAIEPPSQAVNVQATTSLQFRVGTVRFSDNFVGLNTVETYRQPNGLSATLNNTPTITGPAGFLVPANAITTPTGNTDIGTNKISGTPPTQPGTTAVVTTFGTSGGAFSYGFAPANSTSTGAANYAQYQAAGTNTAIYRDFDSAIIDGPGKGNTQGDGTPNIPGITPGVYGASRIGLIANTYMSQFYASSSRRLPFLLGPPAVPDFHSGNFPGGFLGYDSGMTTFNAAPVAGAYSLTVNVPGPNIGVNVATLTSSATLTTTTALPAVTEPVIAPLGLNAVGSGNGGAVFTVAPAPPGVTNQILYIVRVSATSNQPTLYSFNAGAAGGTFTLSPTSGPGGGPPFTPRTCTLGIAGCMGDSVYAYVLGSDYDVLASAPPANTAQNPALPAQADVSISRVYEIAY